MPLVLTLHRTNDTANRQRDSRTLDTGTLSIGRAATEELLVELGRSASRDFAHVVLACAHGGNAAPQEAQNLAVAAFCAVQFGQVRMAYYTPITKQGTRAGIPVHSFSPHPPY